MTYNSFLDGSENHGSGLLSSVNHIQAWIRRSATAGCFSKPCSTRTVVIRPD